MFLAATGLATHIANNKIRSVLLLAGFPFLLALMLYAFFGGMNALAQSSYGGHVNWTLAAQAAGEGIRRYGHWAIIAAGAWFCIAYFFNAQMMRAATNSRPITRAEMPRLYNLLENLCISRGIPMPAFELIDSPALNAFATGINNQTYKIVLTSGIVDALADDELEGVIAHELTHIINRDVRLMIIAVVFVGMLTFLSQLVFRLLVYGPRPGQYDRDRRQGGGYLAALLVAMAVLAVGYIFSVMIRFALSRRREYLADAGAVELTKNPEAMMRALMRISGQDRVRGLPADVQMMCIENSQPFMGLFATHPAIADRIAALSQMTGTPVPVIEEAPPAQAPRPRGPWSRRGPWG